MNQAETSFARSLRAPFRYFRGLAASDGILPARPVKYQGQASCSFMQLPTDFFHAELSSLTHIAAIFPRASWKYLAVNTFVLLEAQRILFDDLHIVVNTGCFKILRKIAFFVQYYPLL